MDITQRTIFGHLANMVREYERLQDERTMLTTGLTARLAEVNADRTALIAEAQAQLDRLNTLRVAAGDPALTLVEVRDMILSRRGRPTA